MTRVTLLLMVVLAMLVHGGQAAKHNQACVTNANCNETPKTWCDSGTCEYDCVTISESTGAYLDSSKYCNSATSLFVDSILSDTELPQIGNQKWADYIDDQVRDIVNGLRDSITAQIQGYTGPNAYANCNTCYDSLRIFFCNNAFGTAGYVECAAQNIFDYLRRDCTEACTKDQCCVTCPRGANTCDPIPTPQSCKLAEVNVFDLAAELVAPCGAYMPSRASCRAALENCMCPTSTRDAEIDNYCSFFSDDGFTVSMPNNDCSSAWCPPSTIGPLSAERHNTTASTSTSASASGPLRLHTTRLQTSGGSSRVGSLELNINEDLSLAAPRGSLLTSSMTITGGGIGITEPPYVSGKENTFSGRDPITSASPPRALPAAAATAALAVVLAALLALAAHHV